jgi:hypothetical protein
MMEVAETPPLSSTNPTAAAATAAPPPPPSSAYVDEIEHLGFPIFFAELELLVSRLKRQAKEEEFGAGDGKGLRE